eukprot:2057337-Lingulodinium_polyedra.AAC.1
MPAPRMPGSLPGRTVSVCQPRQPPPFAGQLFQPRDPGERRVLLGLRDMHPVFTITALIAL